MKAEIKAIPKERSMLFNGEMVNATLDGRKTMTRRIVKNTGFYAIDESIHGHEIAKREQENLITKCPYGKVGERLWVRETWRIAPNASGWSMDENEPCIGWIDYAAGGDKQVTAPNFDSVQRCFPKGKVDWDFLPYSWRPSIFMPRWASRITLEITAIRIERLLDISEADAMAEGVRNTNFDDPVEPSDFSLCPDCGGALVHTDLGANYGVIEVDCNTCDTYKKRFKILWQSINGDESWSANPWVWVVEFKQVAI